jgi:hypothetical protein
MGKALGLARTHKLGKTFKKYLDQLLVACPCTHAIYGVFGTLNLLSHLRYLTSYKLVRDFVVRLLARIS